MSCEVPTRSQSRKELDLKGGNTLFSPNVSWMGGGRGGDASVCYKCPFFVCAVVYGQ